MRVPATARRVVVTGLGVVSPAGTGADAFWQGLRTPPADRQQRRVDDFDATAWLPPQAARRVDRFTQLAVAAGQMAMDDRGDVPVADPAHADYTRLEVTDALLGGSFGSRITSNIREQKGYTYSPFSTVSPRYRSAYWVETADVTTDKTGASLTEIFGEVDRLRREAPPAAELRGIQNYLAGVFTLRNGSRGGVATQLQFLDVHGLPDAYLSGYVGRVSAVTPEDVRRTAETWLAPERMTLVVVGDKKTVEAQVAPFGRTTP